MMATPLSLSVKGLKRISLIYVGGLGGPLLPGVL